MNELVNIIKDVGFPIFIASYLLIVQYKILIQIKNTNCDILKEMKRQNGKGL